MMLDSVRVRHFKAVKDSGVVKLAELTAFIDRNSAGSGPDRDAHHHE